MSNYVLKQNESIIYEDKCRLNNKNAIVTLTSSRLILEQYKGLFKKELKVIKDIALDNIKTVNNKVQVKCLDTTLTIKTIEGNITLNFETNKEAKKLSDKIVNAKTGTNKFDRATSSITKILGTTLTVLTAIGGIAKTSNKIINIFKKK